VSENEIKDGIHRAWQLIRRDVFAAVFVAVGETVDNALIAAKVLDEKLGDLEEREDTKPDALPSLKD
jgi:hypothetical protein